MIIDGRKIAEEILEELKKEISSKKLKLRLAAVLACPEGIEGLALKKFVELKGRVAEGIGISFEMHQFSQDIETDELKEKVGKLVQAVDGALVELPLPKYINTQEILNQIPVEKDVDVLSEEAEKLFYDNRSKILPPAVEALKIVLEKYDINLKGKKAAVFGQGVLVGKPVSYCLEQHGTEVFRINSKTKDPQELSRRADIIVAGVGKPGLVTGDMVKNDAVVIDFGYGKKDGRMLGDVDYSTVSPKASYITPVPGGMGPILIAAVLKNLIELNS